MRRLPSPSRKGLTVLHHSPGARQLTVEVFDVIKALSQERLADATHACQPNDGAFLLVLFDKPLPKAPLYHVHALLHIVLLNAINCSEEISRKIQTRCDCLRPSSGRIGSSHANP